LIFLVDGDQQRLVAKYGRIPERDRWEIAVHQPPDAPRPALVDRRPIHIRDVKAAVRSDFPEIADIARKLPVRTILAMPLLRDGAAVGGS